MGNSDLFALEVGSDVLGRHLALLVIAAARAEHVPQAALGDLGVGG
jgi:hypothetical protein